MTLDCHHIFCCAWAACRWISNIEQPKYRHTVTSSEKMLVLSVYSVLLW